MNRTLVVSALVGLCSLTSSCQDPCVALAERICNCEPTPSDRRSCRNDRITSQQSQVRTEDSDREACAAYLDTCDCAALDTNQLDKCGFVPEGTDAADD